LTNTWALLGSLRYDLENGRPVTDGVGLRYRNDCLSASVLFEQSNITDQDILPETRISVNFALKYLGTYQFKTDTMGLFGDENDTLSE
jgi:lipopolysaccharide assembly outer membrane protein LptD (OstA)